MSFRAFSATLWFASTAFILWIPFVAAFGDVSRLPLLGNMLSRSHLADRTTPILIIVLFGWVLIELARKQRRVRREHAALKKFRPAIAERGENSLEPKPVNLKEPRAVLRAELIAECGSRDPASLHEIVPAAAALDASALSASYGPLHVYAWILPVLGFIGTASGMASAIDGFKDVLRGGQVQVESLALQLSQSVIPGLSAAFETTILALAAALVTYLCTNALRSWDQEALDELDRRSIAFLSRVAQPQATESKSILAALEQLSRQVQELLQTPVAFGEVLSGIKTAAESLDSASKGIASTTDSMSMAAQQLASAGKELHESASAPYHITIKRGSPQ